ncbi:sodium:solute symporter family protein (plasmid) [Cetobacterium somerae]|uniref:sodium:solute symporter family protein n=1 Tax=Cetobacterium somerae TaxID=188913 RepID=UPI003D76A0C2
MVGNLFLNLYFLGILAIGYNSFKKIKDSSYFFIANREAGVLQVTGSLLATVLGSSAILGNIAATYSIGWAGIWLLFCAAFGLLTLLPLLKKFEQFKGYNLPELLGNFYGNEVRILSSLIISIAWIGIVAAQIMGAAQIMEIISDFSYIKSVIISGIFFIIYTILGGQLSIIKTDCFQLIFILLGIVFCFLFLPNLETAYVAPNLFNEKFNYMDLIILVLTYSSTFLVGPDIYSRIFCAKDSSVAKKSIIISIIILIPLAFILTKIGIFAAGAYPNLTNGQSPLLHVAANTLPKPISLLLYFGLLSAIISTADTCLLTASSIFTEIFTKDLKTMKSIKVTRIFISVFGIFSILVALKLKFILSSLLLALSVYSGSLIIPCFMGILGYNFKKNYVLAAIVLGGGVALLGKIYGGPNSNYILIFAFVINALTLLLGRKK